MTAPLVSLASIVALGIIAQWAAWRLRIPSILLLLLSGFVAGSLTGFIQPDALFGKTLFPMVSLAVGIILFEGGLNLKLQELKGMGNDIWWLISIGAFVTWVGGAVAAYMLLDLDLTLAILLGAILVVSGPTVVIPLLNHVRPNSRVASVLKWEGILIDPVGATLAVLVLEGVLAEHEIGLVTLPNIAFGIVRTLFIGSVVGGLGAALLIFVFERQWVPHYLQTAFALMVVLAAFAVSDQITHEAGLMATTLMGVMLANQKRVNIAHIASFKEELGILLLSSLFIVLAGRLEVAQLAELGWGAILFLLALMLVIRPFSILLSTLRSRLTTRERLFLAWMAPRGIVAASVASLFALELEEVSYHGAEQLVPLTFVVVVGTVIIYGLTALPFANWLGIRQQDPQGTLIMGAHPWARAVAEKLHQNGFEVILVDTNRGNVQAARLMGLTAVSGSILSDDILSQIPLERIGRLLALTSNNELNALAAIRLSELVGVANVYQLTAGHAGTPEVVDAKLRGQILFHPEFDFEILDICFDEGGELRRTRLTDKFSYADYQQQYGKTAVPLFILDGDRLQVIVANSPTIPTKGQIIVSLVSPSVAKHLQGDTATS